MRTHVHLPSLSSPSLISGRRKNINIPTNLPIIFSAGPIRNAPPWHSLAIRYILEKDPEVFFACPAWKIDSDLVRFIEKDKSVYELFLRQRAWEQHYMYRAAESGCIFFWLCGEAPEKEFEGKVYSHITMMELGKWIERKKLLPQTRLVIGTDGRFPEWSTIDFEIGTELPTFRICSSLKETVEAALRMASF